MAEALAHRGHEVECRVGPAELVLGSVRDSIVVCVKNRPPSARLRRRGNRIVFDALDYRRRSGRPRGMDAVVSGSDDMGRRMSEQLSAGVPVCTIYLHADPYLEAREADDRELKLVYVGEPHNSRFLGGEIPELSVLSFRVKNWREELRGYNAHFSARSNKNKSVVKLANAAALGAVYLTGREPGCEELLGRDYPFFLHDHNDLRAVRADVQELNDAVGTPLWHSARERLVSARKHLTLAASAVAYERLFSQL